MGVEVQQDNSLICNILMEKNIVMFLVKLQTTCVCVLTHPPTHTERLTNTLRERERPQYSQYYILDCKCMIGYFLIYIDRFCLFVLDKEEAEL